MKVFSSEQIKAWDAYTIANEPVLSVDLMERAAAACVQWILDAPIAKNHFMIFCGKGNNGGDGLAIARMLIQNNYDVDVYIMEQGAQGTADFQINLQRLHKLTHRIHFLQSKEAFPDIQSADVIVDALFGLGLSRSVDGLAAELIRWINAHSAYTISIDMPTGLYADKSSLGNDIIVADHTLSFQCWKQALLMEENAPFVGTVHIIPIGLHPVFASNETSWLNMITGDSLSKRLLSRGSYAHKGDFGHALIIAGSKGKMGAAVLSARACMRSGVGLLTVHVPDCGYSVIQISIPEAMASVDNHKNIFSSLPDSLLAYRTVGIGPGIGTEDATSEAFFELISRYRQSMVLDADALNIMAKKEVDKLEIPSYSILTPHPGEFERLFGSSSNHFERMQLALKKSFELKCVIVLKSKNTLIACPDGSAWICPTGNPGMAKAGSGDVLTGILTGLMARGYDSVVAAKLGVYLHGYAGDLAAVEFGQEAMQAGDLISMLPHAFKAIGK